MCIRDSFIFPSLRCSARNHPSRWHAPHVSFQERPRRARQLTGGMRHRCHAQKSKDSKGTWATSFVRLLQLIGTRCAKTPKRVRQVHGGMRHQYHTKKAAAPHLDACATSITQRFTSSHVTTKNPRKHILKSCASHAQASLARALLTKFSEFCLHSICDKDQHAMNDLPLLTSKCNNVKRPQTAGICFLQYQHQTHTKLVGGYSAYPSRRRKDYNGASALGDIAGIHDTFHD